MKAEGGKTAVGAMPFVCPVPIALVGAVVEGRANFATIGDVGIAGIRPPIVFVSLNRDHYTAGGIREEGVFSINIPTTDMLAVTDCCGMVSGRDMDKSALFDVFHGDLEAAPLIRECPVNLECRVVRTVEIEHRCIFIGEVVQTHLDSDLLEGLSPGELPSLDRLRPILYSLDNGYYEVGKRIGTGYAEGEKVADSASFR